MIRRLIQYLSETYNRFKSGNKGSQHFEHFQSPQSLLGAYVEASKHRYSRLLKRINGSIYESLNILVSTKSFHNNRKIPCIPPVFHENRFVANFKEKAKLFSFFFFAKQYSIIDNVSEVPFVLRPKTDKSFQISRLLKRIAKKLHKI